MKALYSLPFVLVLAASAFPALAQQQAAEATMPMHEQCAKAPMAKHDHGAERGTRAPMAMTGCAPEAAAPAASAQARARHDHAKFHKNQ
ncbi:MAG TPA: hypothetical protein VJ598_07240 [Albitalea sp.]|nr:hypothetical protein [Albitalea sp.]